MEKMIFCLLFGIGLIILGVVNFRGSVSSIHWYNRRKVSEEDMPKYAKCIGIGTGICGFVLLMTALFEYVFGDINADLFIMCGFVVGLAIILYGQFKYNKGLF